MKIALLILSFIFSIFCIVFSTFIFLYDDKSNGLYLFSISLLTIINIRLAWKG